MSLDEHIKTELDLLENFCTPCPPYWGYERAVAALCMESALAPEEEAGDDSDLTPRDCAMFAWAAARTALLAAGIREVGGARCEPTASLATRMYHVLSDMWGWEADAAEVDQAINNPSVRSEGIKHADDIMQIEIDYGGARLRRFRNEVPPEGQRRVPEEYFGQIAEDLRTTQDESRMVLFRAATEFANALVGHRAPGDHRTVAMLLVGAGYSLGVYEQQLGGYPSAAEAFKAQYDALIAALERLANPPTAA